MKRYLQVAILVSITAVQLITNSSATTYTKIGGTPAASPTGGIPYRLPIGSPSRSHNRITGFRAEINNIPGAEIITFNYRISSQYRNYLPVKLELLKRHRPVLRINLSHQKIGQKLNYQIQLANHPALTNGTYIARLSINTKLAHTAKNSYKRVQTRFIVHKTIPVVQTGTGFFPVTGPYNLGGNDSHFGVSRPGHIHQGQDISAAQGTQIVTPRNGTVIWRRYQAEGAGHYLVIKDQENDFYYVFMHLNSGSMLVNQGDTVIAGQPIATVGQTGHASGPHLHFEIWQGGWQTQGSYPVDPLPIINSWKS